MMWSFTNHALSTAMELSEAASPKSADIPQAVAGTLRAEVVRQHAIIANVRALLTAVDAPDTVGSVDWKNNGAHAMWRAAIKKALGE